ncbi:hypothetical protein AURDEDRAFT_162542 [Auricularia subglabra TFB-10046 SS5]|nr:hypothetical protein AURDEDRAFT_162542 [Auricularia subglabra TFB-10046 SS5]
MHRASLRDAAHHHTHWLLIAWLPVFASTAWAAGLLALLVTWLAQGQPYYVSESPSQRIAFISDVGADILKPLFVLVCCTVALGFFFTLIIDARLRSIAQVPPSRRTRVCSGIAIAGAFIGGGALIMLSGFDTRAYETVHRAFLFAFVLGVAVSVISTLVQTYPYREPLRRAHLARLAFALALIAGMLTFLGTLFASVNVAAVVEWCIAFGFAPYLVTFYWDLRAGVIEVIDSRASQPNSTPDMVETGVTP